MKYLIMKVGVLSVLVSQAAYSGQVNNAVVDTVAADEAGLVRITLSGGSETSPKAGCSSSANNNEYIYDIASQAGNAWHSMVLSAQATQKKIHIIGKNSCLSLWGTNSYEAVKTLYILK